MVEIIINGERKSTGLIPRDRSKYPMNCFAFAEPFPDSLLIPEDEIQGRIEYQKEMGAGLLDLRETNYDILKSLDQDGEPLCWSFSSTKAMMYLRVLMGEPGLILSPWFVAGLVKRWRSEGGWGGESLQQIVSTGAPVMALCPSYKSSYDNAECRASAALHKCTEWWEVDENPDKALHQKVSAHLWGLPTVDDFNFISHSMCGVAVTKWKGGPEVVEDNSWGDNSQYGPKGTYVITGNKCRPNGLWIPRVQLPSMV